MVEGFLLIVLVLLYIAFQMYRGFSESAHPYAMQYHRSGMPHQVGLITAVHFEKKRFKTLSDTILFTKELCIQGYAVINVEVQTSPEKAGFSVELIRNSDFETLHYRVTVLGRIGVTRNELESTLRSKPSDGA